MLRLVPIRTLRIHCNRFGPLGVLCAVMTMTTSRDASITASLLVDFDRGFIDLVETHQPGIYSGAYRLLRTPHDAEDVAQETFLRAYRALATYDAERIRTLTPRPWLWTIALNLCRNRWARSKPTSSLDGSAPPSSIDAEPLDTETWNARLDALSTPQRTAVVLRHVVDLSIAEIAEITGRPEGTVKADVSRGLSRLRRALDSEGAHP